MIYMDKIRCSADMRSKMSRWPAGSAEACVSHSKSLHEPSRAGPLPGLGVGLASGHLSQQPWRHVLVGRREDSGSDVQEGQCWGLRRFVGPSPRHWEDCVHGEGWELSSCFKTWIKPASEVRVL